LDTIVAVATPPGLGAVGIVRLSGPYAPAIARRVFRPAKPTTDGLPPRYAVLGTLYDEAGDVDEALALFFPAPHSFTGEDVVELHCHGGPLLLERVVRLALSLGARSAEPGEFTKRAFLNGRLDITQAEAVNEIVRARSDAALRAAVRQLEGGLREQLEPLREGLLALRTEVEASLDFPEETWFDGLTTLSKVEGGEAGSVAPAIEGLLSQARRLTATYHAGRLLREGAKVVIAGKVNVGKSSLLNALLRSQRAIVSETPGTTRDYIQEMLDLEGTPIVVVDTAGIRAPGEGIEAEGLRRSERLIEEADLLLAMLDSSEPLGEEDHRLLALTAGRERLIVLNKWDLPARRMHPDSGGAWDDSPLRRAQGGEQGRTTAVAVSALTGEGIDKLREVLVKAVRGQTAALAEGVAVNLRHYELLKAVEAALERAQQAVGEGLPLDQIASDLTEASNRLGEITGEVLTEEVINRIFSTFCLGK